MRDIFELALISCRSGDPFSTVIVNPQMGVSVWSYKGSELQGAAAGLVSPVGVNGDCIALTMDDKPLLHILAVHTRDRFHQKSVLPGIAKVFAFHPDGTIMCAAIEEKIYTWMLTTGQLHTVISAHYQSISKLRFTSDGCLLVSAGKDGVVQAWSIADLLTPHDAGLEKPEPLRKWSAHSLPITGLCVTSGGLNCRVLTCSSDQTACLHSMTSGECLLTVMADTPLSSCCMDPAETRVFLGCSKGVIVQVNLFVQPVIRERHISTIGDGGEMPLFKHHKASITCLDVNSDGSTLISGDDAGQYAVWDIVSRQCLKSATMKASISTAQFIPNWPSLRDSDTYEKRSSLPICTLQKQLAKQLQSNVPIILRSSKVANEWNERLDELLERRLRGQMDVMPSATEDKQQNEAEVTAMDDVEILEDVPETVAELRKQLENAKRVNKQLYDFAVQRITDKK